MVLLWLTALVATAILSVVLYRAHRERRRLCREVAALEESLRAERDLSRGREQIVATLSHDLQSPLTTMRLSSTELSRRAHQRGDEVEVALAEAFSAAAERSAMLLGELLELARAESGRLELLIQPVDAGELIGNVLRDVALSHETIGECVDLQLSPGSSFPGDGARLRVALRNLVDNAVRYGAEPYRIRLERSATRLAIHVEDAGPGVPLDERERIFERFERGSTSRGRSGAGTGLYLSRQIALLHGGTLSVGDSSLGGADFVLSLPAWTAGNDCPSQTKVEPASSLPRAKAS